VVIRGLLEFLKGILKSFRGDCWVIRGRVESIPGRGIVDAAAESNGTGSGTIQEHFLSQWDESSPVPLHTFYERMIGWSDRLILPIFLSQHSLNTQ
jgi:hypothetical protein